MSIIRSVTAALALSGLATSAHAQSKQCLSQTEASALVGYALPDLLSGVRDKCKLSLPASAFLSSRSTELEARYRVEANSLWPQAKVAFVKMVGEDPMMKKLPDTALRPLLTAAFSTAITDDLKASDCPTANGLVEALAPLPPQNLARLIGLILAAEDKGSDAAGKSGFDICA